MAGLFKWIVLLCIAYIGIMAFLSSNSIIQQTTPVENNTLLGDQSKQMNMFSDLTGSLAPGILLLVAGYIVIRSLGGDS